MMRLKTAGQLLALLGRTNATAETFGSRTFIYISWHTDKERREKEAMLNKAGFPCTRDYAPAYTKSEIRVSTMQRDYWSPFEVQLIYKLNSKTGESYPSTRVVK